MKKLLCLLLAVLMITTMSFTAHAASNSTGLEPGQEMPDFTVSLTDGTTATLSEILQEKDLVVLNIFATWCAPCEIEFPDMEKVYEANKDRMEILSVSAHPQDTMEMVAEYKASHSLTFPMGHAGDSLGFINVTAFPTTIFIARSGSAGSGIVGFVKIGACSEVGSFAEKVNLFLSANYDGAVLPAEEARSILPQLIAIIAASFVLLIIGRWRLFLKAGIPGWYSLIPVLSTYKEFELCWSGVFGIISLLCQAAAGAMALYGPGANWALLLIAALTIARYLLRLLESVKLARAFGKGIGTGILLAIFRSLGRFVLSLTKTEYVGESRGQVR